MNVLYLCHRIPYPPDKGDKIRSFHQVEHLARSHSVHLACLVDRREDLKHVKTLHAYCASIDAVYVGRWAARAAALRALAGTRPLSVAAFFSKELSRRIGRRLAAGGIDVAVAYSAAMAEYLLEHPDLPKVLDLVDVDSEKWRSYGRHHAFPVSWLYRLEADRLERYESRVSDRFAESLLATDAEAELFRERAGPRPLTVIPNGVDVEYFSSSAGAAAGPAPGVVFTGAMDYFPNVDAVTHFCDRILPRILDAIPEATFTIVGRHPAPAVRGLASRPRVTVTGGVPDVRPHLERAWVSVAPFRIARGVQNKILEAMAMERPVVGSPVAFQGLAAREEDGVRIAEDPDAFADLVVGLLRNEALRRDCGRRARSYVERRHRWREHGAALEAAMDRAIARSHRSPKSRVAR